MILLQLSSAQGPEECCLAVKKALDRLIKEAARQDVAVTVLETETGRYSDTLRSALVSLDGDNAWALSESWWHYSVDLSESVSASSWAQKLVSGHWAFYR